MAYFDFAPHASPNKLFSSVCYNRGAFYSFLFFLHILMTSFLTTKLFSFIFHEHGSHSPLFFLHVLITLYLLYGASCIFSYEQGIPHPFVLSEVRSTKSKYITKKSMPDDSGRCWSSLLRGADNE